MYDRVLAASHLGTEQHRLVSNYAQQIQSRHGDSGSVRLHIQLDSFIGQKPIVLAISLKSSSNPKSEKQFGIQLLAKTFEEYDYSYENEPEQGRRSTIKRHLPFYFSVSLTR